MSGVTPPLPNTSSWRGAQLKNSTRTILPFLPLPFHLSGLRLGPLKTIYLHTQVLIQNSGR
jgi:hypothetical protein